MQQYEILGKIGEGGMAEVYKAVQKSLGRVVAVKKIRPILSQDPNFLKRFEREAKAVASLNFPNIIQVYDYGQEGGVFFIAMEYIEGRSLKEYLEENLLSIPLSAIIIREVASALKYAHKHGVIHRDIKPANIIINREGIVKLTDFGIAQAINLRPSTISLSGELVGTPAYMSPEQAAGEKIDLRTDIFSLGVVFYTILTGKNPFAGKTTTSTVYKIVHENYPPPLEFNQAIPPSLLQILEQALKKEPAQRFQKVDEIIILLDKFLREIGIIDLKKELEEYVQNPPLYLKSSRERFIKFRLGQGVKLTEERRYKEAIYEFKAVLEMEPTNQTALEYLGKAEERQQFVKEREDTLISSPPLVDKKRNLFKKVALSGGLGFLLIFSLFLWGRGRSGRQGISLAPPVEEGKLPVTKPLPPPGEGQKKPPPPPSGNQKKKKIAPGFLEINAEPGAIVYINGQKKGVLPLKKRIRLKPGRYHVKIQRPISKDVWEKTYQIKPQSEVVIDLDVPETELEVKGFPPGTQIYLNGKLIGTVVVKRAQFRVKCGQYEAVLKHPIYGEWRQKIEVRPGESFILETLSEEAE